MSSATFSTQPRRDVAQLPVVSSLEDEHEVLKEKVRVQETQIRIQMEMIARQQERIEMLEKMISSNLFVIN